MSDEYESDEPVISNQTAPESTDSFDTSVAVVLPCEPDHFRDFLAGILGKPQTIAKTFTGIFEISIEDIENFYSLLDQRVKQQNEATLIQFTTTIIYDDHSSVLLNSLEDFKSYNEVRPVTSTGVTLSWTYLVIFHDRKAPERQQIDVTFMTVWGGPMLIIESDLAFPWEENRSGGLITFRISHTARTWGADIEALLTGHIKSLLKTQNKVKKFIYSNSGKIGNAVGAIFLSSAVIAGFYSINTFLIDQMSAAGELIKTGISGAENISRKVDFIVNLIAEGAWPRFMFSMSGFLFFAIIVSVALGIWVATTATTREPSFVLLTKKSREKKIDTLAKVKRAWVWFIVSILSGVIASTIGNLLFVTFFGK